jgi:hypothetical protein
MTRPDERSAKSDLAVEPVVRPRLFLLHPEPKVLHDEQDAGGHGEHAADPERNRQPEHEIQAEDDEKKGKDEVGHGG